MFDPQHYKNLRLLILVLIDQNILLKEMFSNEDGAYVSIKCYKHFKLNETTNLHACFNYYGEDEWFDWIMIDWGESYGQLPAKLVCFVDASEISVKKSNDVEQYEVQRTGNNESNILCLVSLVR